MINFDAFFAAEYDALVGWLRRSFDRETSEDAAAFAFTQVAAGKLPEDHAAPTAWLKVVARNEALALVEQAQRGGLLLMDDDEATFEPHAGDSADPAFVAEVRESLHLLKQLKPAEAKVLVMLAAGWSYKEIAEDLAQSYTWVNRYASEGRAHLRRLSEGGE